MVSDPAYNLAFIASKNSMKPHNDQTSCDIKTGLQKKKHHPVTPYSAQTAGPNNTQKLH